MFLNEIQTLSSLSHEIMGLTIRKQNKAQPSLIGPVKQIFSV